MLVTDVVIELYFACIHFTEVLMSVFTIAMVMLL